ncbi:phosphate acyltransferase [Burkholderia ambifaria]|uniref:phosphate acyltransferase n=1 Tax=Burkholderia ambifaria TaxID=152480 RepID=UPI003CEBF937
MDDVLEDRCRARASSKEMARVEMRRRLTLIGAMMVRLGDADGMICGTVGEYHNHLRFVDQVIGKTPGLKRRPTRR